MSSTSNTNVIGTGSSDVTATAMSASDLLSKEIRSSWDLAWKNLRIVQYHAQDYGKDIANEEDDQYILTEGTKLIDHLSKAVEQVRTDVHQVLVHSSKGEVESGCPLEETEVSFSVKEDLGSRTASSAVFSLCAAVRHGLYEIEERFNIMKQRKRKAVTVDYKDDPTDLITVIRRADSLLHELTALKAGVKWLYDPNDNGKTKNDLLTAWQDSGDD